MSELYVIPVLGARVRHPVENRPIKSEGEPVPRTSYILERLREGDLVTPREESDVVAVKSPGKKGVN